MNEFHKPEPREVESPLKHAKDVLYDPKGKQEAILPTLQKRNAPALEEWKRFAPKSGLKLPITFKVPSSQQFLLFSVGFFVLALIISGAFLFFGSRFISTEHVDITIDTPTTIAGGDVVPILVTVTNQNPTALKEARLRLEFPSGTFSSDGSRALPRYEEELGTIESGQKIERTVEAVLYGDEQSVITIPATLTYATDNSNSEFQKKKAFSITIGSSPVNVSIKNVSEIASGQELSFVVTVRSNAPSELKHVALSVEYPFGFVPSSQEPAGLTNDFFYIGTLNKGEEREFTLKGMMNGQDKDERVFRFSVGQAKNEGSTALPLTFISKDAKVTITKSFLATQFRINSESEDTVIVAPDDTVQGSISFENSLDTSINNVELVLTLRGEAIQQSSISSQDGFFDSNRNSIMFNKETLSLLASLEPRDRGTASFWYSLIPLEKLGLMRNPSMQLTLESRGRGEGTGTALLSSTVTKTVKVSSDLGLSMRSLRTVGPLVNTGPWPPKVGETSTYSIAMTAHNNINSVADAKVITTLPSHVTYTGQTSVPQGTVSYNEVTREVVWSIGELPSGAGEVEGMFQISITPSISQKGTNLDVALNPTIVGFDRFVQKEISEEVDDVTTQILTDPIYDGTKGSVE